MLNSIVDVARRAAEECSDLFPRPNAFELECLKSPFLMTSKKKTYAAVEFVPGAEGWDKKTAGHFLLKGMTMTKRDKCRVVREVGRGLMQRLLFEGWQESDIVAWFRDQVKRVCGDPEDLGDFVTTSQISEEYKNENVVGTTLRRIVEEDTGTRPQVGSRVPFLVFFSEDPEKKHFEKVTTVDRFRRMGHCIDVEYYLYKQLLTSLDQALCHHTTLLGELRTILDDRARDHRRQASRHRRCSIFREKKS